MKKFSVITHFDLGNYKLVTVSCANPFHALVPWHYLIMGETKYPLREFRKYQVSNLVYENLCVTYHAGFIK